MTATTPNAEARAIELEEGEPLEFECRHFLDCVATGTRPRTDGQEGLRVLRVPIDMPWISERPVAATASANHAFVRVADEFGDWRPDVVHAYSLFSPAALALKSTRAPPSRPAGISRFQGRMDRDLLRRTRSRGERGAASGGAGRSRRRAHCTAPPP